MAFERTLPQGLDIRITNEWDGAEAERRIFDLTETDGTVNYDEARRFFGFSNPDEAGDRGAHKFPVAVPDSDGNPVVDSRGVRAALSFLNRGDITDTSQAQQDDLRRVLEGYQARIDEMENKAKRIKGLITLNVADSETEAEIVKLLRQLQFMGEAGMSREVVIPRSNDNNSDFTIFFDGDGSARIENILVNGKGVKRTYRLGKDVHDAIALADYRPALTDATCSNCDFSREGNCELFRFATNPNFTCNKWRLERDMAIEHVDMLMSEEVVTMQADFPDNVRPTDAGMSVDEAVESFVDASQGFSDGGLVAPPDDNEESRGFLNWLKGKYNEWKARNDEQPVNLAAFKNKKGEWLYAGTFSNMYRDQDGIPEILSSAAHKRYADMVMSGEHEIPKLFVAHMELPVGEAEVVGYDDSGFAFVLGKYYEDYYFVAEAISKNPAPLGMSHGFWESTVKRDENDRTIITEYYSHEHSPLPIGEAANVLTSFANLQKGMNMLDERTRANVRDTLGDDEAARRLIAQFEDENKQRSALADELGMDRKQKTQEVNMSTEVEQEVTHEAEMVDTPPAEVVTDESEVNDVLGDALDTIEALANQVEEQGKQLHEMQARHEEVENALLAEVKALRQEIHAHNVTGKIIEGAPTGTTPKRPETFKQQLQRIKSRINDGGAIDEAGLGIISDESKFANQMPAKGLSQEYQRHGIGVGEEYA